MHKFSFSKIALEIQQESFKRNYQTIIVFRKIIQKKKKLGLELQIREKVDKSVHFWMKQVFRKNISFLKLVSRKLCTLLICQKTLNTPKNSLMFEAFVWIMISISSDMETGNSNWCLIQRVWQLTEQILAQSNISRPGYP